MFDCSLYLVTDRRLALGRTTIEIVRAAVEGGVTCVQLREKHASTREFLDEARRVRELLAGTNVPLIINDRLDVALAVGADGVHLGQTDMHISDARRLVGERLVIGISAESVADAIRAEAEGADYIGVSPVFTTPTKMDTAPPLGLEGLREIRRAVACRWWPSVPSATTTPPRSCAPGPTAWPWSRPSSARPARARPLPPSDNRSPSPEKRNVHARKIPITGS